MLKTVNALYQEAKPAADKTVKVLKRKRSSLLAEGVTRKASSSSNGDLLKPRKQSKPRKSPSATEQSNRDEKRKSSVEDGKRLRKSKTEIMEKPRVSRSKSIVDDLKLTPGSKSLLDLRRESAAKVATRKTSANKGDTSKLKVDTTTKRSGMKLTQNEAKTKKPEKEQKLENLLKVIRSEDLKKLTTLPFVSQELHEERMAVLRQIVTQAELDRRIFCMFDRRRHVTNPIREELFKRGWEEYQPEKGTVLRKNFSSPSKVASTSQLKRSTAQDTVTQNPTGADRTAKAMFPSSGGGKALYVSSPVETDVPVKENQDILEYGTTWETVLSPNKRKRHSGCTLRTPAESSYMSRYIEENNTQVAMVILSSKPELQLSYFSYIPDVVNKFQKTSFCTKYGLWLNLKNKYPNLKYVKYPVQTPRMYNLGDRQNYQDFAFDFYTTATTSILRWLVVKLSVEGVSSVSSKSGKVPANVFKFAVKKTKQLVSYLKNDNSVTRDEMMRSDSNWRNLLLWFYKLVNEQEKMEAISTPALFILHSQAVEVLRTLREIKPESVNDGMTNLWIVKPYSASCGRGIFITNNFYYIEQLEQKRYIIQKYIERPFLISGVKFDIRQWFLVTSLTPLKIWTYKECYLRFCSVPFNLQNLHESLHLTNNAIQKKYAKFAGLPCQNMWDSNTFRRYLRETGYPNIWEERIYPGMKDALIATLLCSESTFDTAESKFPPRNGWFEVYGADFMLTQDLREGPWLIEINENPALDASTPITAQLCPKMLRDVVKVTVDWRSDPKASTGEWELAFSGKEEK